MEWGTVILFIIHTLYKEVNKYSVEMKESQYTHNMV